MSQVPLVFECKRPRAAAQDRVDLEQVADRKEQDDVYEPIHITEQYSPLIKEKNVISNTDCTTREIELES